MKKRFYLITIFLIILLPTLSGAFYWFQVRPSQIKHECSWVKRHADAIPAKAGKTETQLKAEGKLKDCAAIPASSNNEPGVTFSLLRNNLCYVENAEVIKRNKPQTYVPAKNWYEKATKEEYTFCLHDKGL